MSTSKSTVLAGAKFFHGMVHDLKSDFAKATAEYHLQFTPDGKYATANHGNYKFTYYKNGHFFCVPCSKEEVAAW
jgi:hypothetical protein